jgi:ribosomal protein S18 acetylase RimI-like enzyme
MFQVRKLNPQNLEEIKFVTQVDSEVANLFLPWNTVNRDWVNQKIESLKNIDESRELFLIALDNDLIVGFHYVGISKWNPLRADIFTTWVDVKYRKKNIAYTLKSQAENWAKLQGVRYLLTGVDELNTPMNSLNQKMGFKSIRTHYLKEL